MPPALIILLAAVSGYFSLMETALIECHRGRLEKLSEDGDADAKAVLEMTESPAPLNVAQIGITFTGILAGVCAVLTIPLIAAQINFLEQAEIISAAAALIATTFIFLLFGEFLPKQAAKRDPENFLLSRYKTFRLIVAIMNPFVILLSKIAGGLGFIFGMNSNKNDAVTEDEVLDLIEQGTEDGTIEKSEQEMVDRIFDVGDETAYSLMTPRVMIVWLDLDDSLEKNLKIVQESPHTIFPVGYGSLDDCRGLIYVKDLLDALLKDGRDIDLEKLIRKANYVPRTMEAFRIVEKFRSSGITEAMVNDEYGGVIGFITLDDIVREIVDTSGDDKDNEPQFIKNKDNSWTVDGLCDIDEFKERFDIETLPDEEHDHFQTMGGFLTACFGYIPKVGESYEWNGFRFKVKEMDGVRIGKILITQIHLKADS
ncbi:MAG: HlyC/CorC family transporter [Selenomonadaceae bacterium]|nr:HlyC/CorC family transporter [Selenomonadaceae bacterium]